MFLVVSKTLPSRNVDRCFTRTEKTSIPCRNYTVYYYFRSTPTKKIENSRSYRTISANKANGEDKLSPFSGPLQFFVHRWHSNSVFVWSANPFSYHAHIVIIPNDQSNFFFVCNSNAQKKKQQKIENQTETVLDRDETQLNSFGQTEVTES